VDCLRPLTEVAKPFSLIPAWSIELPYRDILDRFGVYAVMKALDPAKNLVELTAERSAPMVILRFVVLGKNFLD